MAAAAAAPEADGPFQNMSVNDFLAQNAGALAQMREQFKEVQRKRDEANGFVGDITFGRLGQSTLVLEGREGEGEDEAEIDASVPLLIGLVQKGDLAPVALALDSGADVNTRDGEGMTALMWAVDRSKGPLVELLLQRGADVAAADGEGQTALHYAVLSAEELVAPLLAAGADPAAEDADGETALSQMSAELRASVGL